MKRCKCLFAFWIVTLLAWRLHGASPDPIAGEWAGTLAGKLHIVFHVDRAADGALHCILESVDQGDAKIPADTASFDDKRTLHMDMKRIGATYEGKLSDDGTVVDGYFQQGGAQLSLILRRPGAAAPVPTLKAMTRGSIPLKPCLAADGNTQALCGTYEVFENRASRAGRRIALNLMLLPATAGKPEPDPVMALAGGPGQSAVTAFPALALIKILREQRDIVLIDQRGTGKSNPLNCAIDFNNPQAMVDGAYSTDMLPGCRAELEKRADLTQYTTTNSVDDFDDVRAALGYDKVNLFGGSYGTLAALVYLRRHGAQVRSVTLEGVVPPDYLLPLTFAKTIQEALDHLFADCAADAACHQSFPNLKNDFEATVERLEHEPAKLDLPNQSSKTSQTVLISRRAFVADLRPLLYQPAIVSQLPLILERAYRNDWRPFASVAIAMHRAIAGDIARGMSFSVFCSEMVPSATEAQIRHETAGTYLGDRDFRLYQKNCGLWAHAEPPADIAAAVRSDVPALLIAGEEDPATPASFARHVAETLTHSRVVAIPNGTHLSGAACLDDMIVHFVSAASAQGIGESCVAKIHNPPFATLPKAGKSGQ